MEDFAQLNDALLSAEAEEDEQKEPKRNTKDSLISKIVKLHEEQEVPLMFKKMFVVAFPVLSTFRSSILSCVVVGCIPSDVKNAWRPSE